MFDFGFAELILILVIALLVVGPERLPGIARRAGLWIGRARRVVQNVRDDIEREVAADELKRVMKEQSESSGVHEILEEGRQAVDEVKGAVEDTERRASASAQDQADQDYLVRAVSEEQPAEDEAPQAGESSDSSNRSSEPSPDHDKQT